MRTRFFAILCFLILITSAGCKINQSAEILFTHKFSTEYIQVYPPADEMFYSRLERFSGSDNNLASLKIFFHHTFFQPSKITYTIDGNEQKTIMDSTVVLNFNKNAKTVINSEIRLFCSFENGKNREYFMKISFDPKIIYEISGKNENIDDAFIVHQTNINYAPCSVNMFTAYSPSGAEIKKVREEFDSHIDSSDKDIEKTEKIALYILEKLADHRGTPSDSMNQINPFQQFKRAVCGSDKVWCSNIADIFSYVNICYGIPSRKVGLGFSYDSKSNPLMLNSEGHTNTEVYDNKTKSWRMVDLTFNILGAFYQKDQALNTMDFYYLLNSPELNNNIYINYYDGTKKSASLIKLKSSPVYNSVLNYYKTNTKFFYPCNGVLLPL